MPSPTGMQLYDPQDHRLSLTGSEPRSFRQAVEAVPARSTPRARRCCLPAVALPRPSHCSPSLFLHSTTRAVHGSEEIALLKFHDQLLIRLFGFDGLLIGTQHQFRCRRMVCCMNHIVHDVPAILSLIDGPWFDSAVPQLLLESFQKVRQSWIGWHGTPCGPPIPRPTMRVSAWYSFLLGRKSPGKP